jgi:hypothetical protein
MILFRVGLNYQVRVDVMRYAQKHGGHVVFDCEQILVGMLHSQTARHFNRSHRQ